jgi:dethiobiotin synthetase
MTGSASHRVAETGSSRPGNGLFITGTDTGVGKTAVACALACLGRRRGIPLMPFKPVETGCQPDPQDALALWRAAQPPVSPASVCPFPFPLAAAPAVAARAAGTTLSAQAILQHAAALATHGRPLLVEGAGGLLVPYAPSLTTADLAAALGLPVLVVARAGLGTINHTALTLAELRRHRLVLAGTILVESLPGQYDPRLDSVDQILALTGVAPLGILPYVPEPTPETLADALLAALGPVAVDRLLTSERSAF